MGSKGVGIKKVLSEVEEMKVFETEIKVRYSETDQMGIVHHSRYYPWFELARTEMFEELGYGYDQMEQDGLMLPLAESSCKYIKGAKYPEVLTIKTHIESFNGVKIIFIYEVFRKSDGVLIAQGKTIQAVVGMDFRLVNVKKARPELYELIQGLL